MPALVVDRPSLPAAQEDGAQVMQEGISVLEGYTPQPFPNLSDQSRVKPSRLQASRSVTSPSIGGHDERAAVALARAAWVRLAMAYADVDDIVFNELSVTSTGLEVTFARLRSPNDITNDDAVQALSRDALHGQSYDATKMELTGLVSFLGNSDIPSDWWPRSGIALGAKSDLAESSLRISIVTDASHCSESAAANLLSQMEALMVEIATHHQAAFMKGGKPSLAFASHESQGDALYSAFHASYDPRRARLPIDWLYEQGRQRPEAVAHELYATGTSPEQVLTYGDLDKKSNQMARWLQAHAGVGQETRVGICRERDEAFYVCMAATLKAGGCYVPIDIDLPAERKRFIASDSSAAVVLCRSGEEQNFDSPSQETDNAAIWRAVSLLSSEPLDTSAISLDSLSYLQYTSGTTGTPKGCKLTHRGLFWAIEAMVEMPSRITNPDTDKRLAMAAVAFDVHVSEIVQSWALGTRLVSVRSRLELISNLQQYIEDFGITHIGMVPSMIESCLFKSPEELPLKYMVSGGDKLSDEVLSKWAAHPKLLFAQFYGPSECHIGCLARRMRGIMDRKDNIGLPFPGSSAYVVDADLNIVPRGIPGELVIEGDLVGTGYLGLEEATKKNFVAFPRSGCRAYRTGDLVRMNHDGSILISGRVDSQIKLRGVRIESEGVSNVIRKASSRLPLEAVTAIATHPETGSAEILVTFVAPHGEYTAVQRRENPSLEALPGDLGATLRQAAETELASYMRPGHIVPVKFLPLSHNGKVDVKLLVQMFKQSSMQALQAAQKLAMAIDAHAEDDVGRDLSASELIVCDLISSLIEISGLQLRPNKRLFELGLSSLQFARLTGLLNKRFNSRLSVAAVMSASTIAGAAQLVEQDSDRPGSSSDEGIDLSAFHHANFAPAAAVFRPDDIEAILPPLPVQPGILAQIVQPTSTSSYVQHFLYRVRSSQTAACVENAIEKVVRTHEMLRTVFLVDEAELAQIVLKSESVKIPIFRHHDEVTGQSDFVACFQDQVAASVAARINDDLTTPMWEIGLYTEGSPGTVQYLTLSLSHVVYDAFATAALMRHLDSTLAGEADSPRPSLQSVAQAIGQISSEQHRQFWSSFLAPALAAPDRAPPRRLTSSKATRQTRLLDIPMSDVRSRCSKVGITAEAFFNAAFAMSGQQASLWHSHAIFGTVQSGRSLGLDGIESAVMPLVTVFPMAVDVSTRNAASALTSAQRGLLATSTHSHFPLGQVQAAVGQTQLFDLLFSCRQAHAPRRYRHFSHLETSDTTLEFPMAIEVLFDESADTIQVKAASSDSEFAPLVVANLLALFEETVTDLAAQEDLPPIALTGEASLPDAVSGSVNTEQKQEDDNPVDPQMLSTIMRTTAAFLKLDEQKVGPNTSLVSLGVTSLSAVALAMRCQEAGVNIDAISILQGDRPRRIAGLVKPSQTATDEGPTGRDDAPSAIETQLNAELNASAVAFDVEDNISVSPATPLQEGMLSQTVATRGQSYVHAFPLVLSAGTDVNQLQTAWKVAMATFDILRTTFHFASESGRWAAVVHSVPAVQLPWSETTSDEPAELLSKNAVADMSLKDSTDFALRPPWRLILVTRNARPNERILIMAAHHATYDGASMHSLMQHVSAAYNGRSIPSTASGHFQDFARQVSRRVDASVAFWINVLKSSAATGLPSMPSGRSIVASPTNKAWRASAAVDSSITDDLSRLCRRYRITSQSVAQLALARAVSLWSGVRDVIVCQVVGGRTAKGTGELVGPCFNTIPCRINLSEKLSARDGLKGVHTGNMQALPHQHAPLRAIQKGCGVAAISDVLFVFQPRLAGSDKGDDVDIWQAAPRSSEVNETTTHFALNLEVWEKANGLEIKSSASVDCMRKREELQDFLELYIGCLRSLVNAPADKILPTEWTPRFPVRRPDQATSSVTDVGQGDDVPFASDAELQDSVSGQAVLEALCRTTKLDRSKIALSSGLASLGLDSIAAIQVASHARRSGIQLSPADVVRSPTVRALLATVLKHEHEANNTSDAALSATSPAVDPMKRQDARIPVELLRRAESKLLPELRGKVSAWRPTPGMETVYSGWQSSGGHFAQMVLIREAAQEIDVERLQHAWNALTSRHETLRSTMVPLSSEGQDRCALMLVDSPQDWTPDFEVRAYDDEGLSGQDKAVAVAKGFLLDPPPIHSPPNKMVVLRKAAQVTHVVLYLPHFQYDGWSLGPLMRDLEALYVGAEPTANYDLRGLLRACSVCEGDDGLEAKYWKKELSDVDLSAGHLQSRGMTDSPGTAAQAITLYRSLDSDTMPLMSELNEAAKKQDVTLSALFFATWSMVQRQRAASESADHACFSVVQHGRGLALDGIANLATITMNLAPLVVSFDSASRHKSAHTEVFGLARQIQDKLNERPAEADQCRWREISHWIGRDQTTPLSNVVLNVQHFVQKGQATADDIRTSSPSQRTPASPAFWKPLVVPLRLSEEEQMTHALDWEHLGQPSPTTLSFGEMTQSILRIGVRSNRDTGRLVLHAEYVKTALAGDEVEQMLEQWRALCEGLIH